MFFQNLIDFFIRHFTTKLSKRIFYVLEAYLAGVVDIELVENGLELLLRQYLLEVDRRSYEFTVVYLGIQVVVHARNYRRDFFGRNVGPDPRDGLLQLAYINQAGVVGVHALKLLSQRAHLDGVDNFDQTVKRRLVQRRLRLESLQVLNDVLGYFDGDFVLTSRRVSLCEHFEPFVLQSLLRTESFFRVDANHRPQQVPALARASVGFGVHARPDFVEHLGSAGSLERQRPCDQHKHNASQRPNIALGTIVSVENVRGHKVGCACDLR